MVGFTPVVGTRGFYAVTGGSCIDWARDIKVGEKMKVVFSCFMGSKDNHGPAYTVRKQANKLSPYIMEAIPFIRISLTFQLR